MKRWIFGLVAILAFSMTSCLDMMEEITLNQDGSGIYELKFDMGALFSDPFMMSIMAEAMQEEGGPSEIEVDSMINMAGNLPVDATARERELANRIEARMQMSQSKGIGLMTIKFPFNNVAEINEFQEVFGKMDDDGSGMGGMMGGGLTPNSSLFSLDGRTLIRSIPDVEMDMMEMLDDETMSMMKMMFADASWTTTYHLPGRVRSCDIEGAEVDGKTVVVQLPFLELIEEQPNLSGSIKFRRR
jgi:hypothetical protein